MIDSLDEQLCEVEKKTIIDCLKDLYAIKDHLHAEKLYDFICDLQDGKKALQEEFEFKINSALDEVYENAEFEAEQDKKKNIFLR